MKTLRLALVVLGLGLAIAATADAPTEQVRASVTVGDINLDSPEGIEKLYARVRRSAANACGLRSYRELGSLRTYLDARECYDDLVAKLVAEIDSPRLQTLHASL